MRETAIQPVVAAPFSDCERIGYVAPDGEEVVFVVLAIQTIVGNDFALVAREEDLGRPELAMAFEYHTDPDGEAFLAPVECEDLYDDVMQLFADLVDE